MTEFTDIIQLLIELGIAGGLALNALRTGKALGILHEIREAIDATDDAVQPDADGEVRITPGEAADILQEWQDVIGRIRPDQ